MKKKHRLIKMFENRRTVNKEMAERIGVENFRQQIYFLRQDGRIIINIAPRTYKLIQ